MYKQQVHWNWFRAVIFIHEEALNNKLMVRARTKVKQYKELKVLMTRSPHNSLSDTIYFLTFPFYFLAPLLSKTPLGQWLKMKEQNKSINKVQIYYDHTQCCAYDTFSAYNMNTIYIPC